MMRSTPSLIMAVFLLAANLRAPIVSVGPVLQEIGTARGLSYTAIGLLGTLPVLAFALVSPWVRSLAARFGLEYTVGLGLIAIAVGAFIRSALPSAFALMAGTLLLCGGIAIGNVLLAAAIRRDFPNHIEKMSSFQMFTFGIMQGLAAWLAVPIANHFGWQWAIGIWALVAVPAAVLWFALAQGAPPMSASVAQKTHNIWRSTLAWKISLYMGLQSLTFYTLVNWLPLFLQSRGMAPEVAGYIVALFQAITIPTVIFIAPLSERGNMVTLLTVSGGVVLAGVLGLWYLPVNWAWVTATIAGMGGAATFTFCLMLFGLRGRDAGESAALSGMSQTVGYCIAAIGPLLLGKLLEISGSWGAPWAALCCAAAGIMLTGPLAGKRGNL